MSLVIKLLGLDARALKPDKLLFRLKVLYRKWKASGSLKGFRDGVNSFYLARERMDENRQEALQTVESEVDEEIDISYETKLYLPLEILLGLIYERNGYRAGERPEEVEEAEDLFRNLAGLFLEIDLRDAVIDDELEKMKITGGEVDPEKLFEDGREALKREYYDEGLESYGSEISSIYDKGIEIAMEHQRSQDEFEKVMGEARRKNSFDELMSLYRDADLEDMIGERIEALPYFATQYERVAVLYDAVISILAEKGLEISDEDREAIIYDVIGAQIWLDDVSDLKQDIEDDQLTPVTAEIARASDLEEAQQSIRELKDDYLDEAREKAKESDSVLQEIAVEYIDLKGEEKDISRKLRSIDVPKGASR
ncbi:MAG: hypothetical protein ABEJ98_00805 [Candidatus Nanohaloarchaea archaeon]